MLLNAVIIQKLIESDQLDYVLKFISDSAQATSQIVMNVLHSL